jgi:hypothetical protein
MDIVLPPDFKEFLSLLKDKKIQNGKTNGFGSEGVWF